MVFLPKRQAGRRAKMISSIKIAKRSVLPKYKSDETKGRKTVDKNLSLGFKWASLSKEESSKGLREEFPHFV